MATRAIAQAVSGRYAAPDDRSLIEGQAPMAERCRKVRRGDRDTLAIDYVLRGGSLAIDVVSPPQRTQNEP